VFLYCIFIPSIGLYCIVLHCIALYCIVLYFIVDLPSHSNSFLVFATDVCNVFVRDMPRHAANVLSVQNIRSATARELCDRAHLPNTWAFPPQVEKAQNSIDEKAAAEMLKNMLSNKFDMDDFLEQYKSVTRMGSLSTVVKMIPGMTKIDDKDLVDVEKKFVIYESIINVRRPSRSVALRVCW
jgi:hypothetical protein